LLNTALCNLNAIQTTWPGGNPSKEIWSLKSQNNYCHLSLEAGKSIAPPPKKKKKKKKKNH
jgi:hypothetical protein